MHSICFELQKSIPNLLSQHLLIVDVIFLDLNCPAQRRGRLIRGSAYTRVYTVHKRMINTVSKYV